MNVSEYEHKEEEKRALRLATERRTEQLAKIIRPLRTAGYEVTAEWRRIERALREYEQDYGGLDMNPDFQRGHVWTPEQKQHYIESVMRGTVSTSGLLVQFNCPNWDNDNYNGDLPRGFQCIDGLQRITAVLGFLSGEVRPFGFTPQDLDGSYFSVKTNYSFKVAVHNFTTKAELLQHYLDLNAGGTPHSTEELDRVRGMLANIVGNMPPSRKKDGPGM